MATQIKFKSYLFLLFLVLFSGCEKTKANHASNNTVSTTVKSEEKQPKIQVVFLLDATGSMSGLIGTAKEKIWSIAGSFTQTVPTPKIEIGMIFYRDRGDEFITKQIPMGTPMDDLYEELMTIQAAGGGDMPESVNQALWEAVTDMQWDKDKDTYRAIFLVGDCPPHMDYQDDVKYPVSCAEANKRNIIINTILMGNDRQAHAIWSEIAKKTNGEFIQTDMRVNNISIATPLDERIKALQRELDNTRIYYGKSKEVNEKKKSQSEKIMMEDASVNARRAEYNLSESGKTSYYGSDELISSVQKGKKLSEISASDLPEELKKMSSVELQKYVNDNIAKREKLEKKILELNKQRQVYIDDKLKEMDQETVESSFDDVVFEAVKVQAAKKEIQIEGKAKR